YAHKNTLPCAQHSSDISFELRLVFCLFSGKGPPDFSPPPEGVGKPSFTARIERPLPYRGRSASKKDGCLLPCIPLSGHVLRAQGTDMSALGLNEGLFREQSSLRTFLRGGIYQSPPPSCALRQWPRR